LLSCKLRVVELRVAELLSCKLLSWELQVVELS